MKGLLALIHWRYQMLNKCYILYMTFIYFQEVCSVCICSVFSPGKVFWSSLTTGNSFTSSLSSLLRDSQQLQSKFNSCFVCSSSKWKDFKCQPSKPGTSSQLTRILYTSPTSPVSTCKKTSRGSAYCQDRFTHSNFLSSVESFNLTLTNGETVLEGKMRVIRESLLLFSMNETASFILFYFLSSNV